MVRKCATLGTSLQAARSGGGWQRGRPLVQADRRALEAHGHTGRGYQPLDCLLPASLPGLPAAWQHLQQDPCPAEMQPRLGPSVPPPPPSPPQNHVGHAAAVERAHALVVAVAQRVGGPDIQVLAHQWYRQPRVQQVDGDAAELRAAGSRAGLPVGPMCRRFYRYVRRQLVNKMQGQFHPEQAPHHQRGQPRPHLHLHDGHIGPRDRSQRLNIRQLAQNGLRKRQRRKQIILLRAGVCKQGAGQLKAG